ncbi:MAG TPA: hypothetical protein VNF68_06220 [Candidatus Baltobacteraceae bacterium]|nr:hypothetical protein [Candidatus Baltobacteraceae bacterium]
MEANQTYPLRALSIGEIFDRAITIYVRHLVPLTLIVMTLIVPLTFAQGFLLRDQTQGIAAAIQEIEHPTANKKAPPTLDFAVIFLIAGVSLLLAPIVNDAVAVGVASVYSAKAPTYDKSFAAVLPRIFPLIGTTLLEALVMFGAYVGCVLLLSLILILGIATVAGSLPFAIVMFVIAGAGALATLALFAVLFIGFGFATYATVLERQGPGAAVGGAFRRLFNRNELRKVLLMGLASLALNVGVVMLSGTVSLVIELVVKNQAIDLGVNAVISSMSTAFLTVLLAVYYYDVRTRSEGLDLEVDLARLTAAS